MGFADLLVKLKIPYESHQGLYIGKILMRAILDTAREESVKLGKVKGKWPGAVGVSENKRNACLLTVAPTGTISMIAECSGGIEPLFSLAYRKTEHFRGADSLLCE